MSLDDSFGPQFRVASDIQFSKNFPAAIIPEPQLDLAAATLDELAALARAEAHAVTLALAEGVRRAIRLGEILMECRSRVTDENWTEWLANNTDLTVGYAAHFIRLATHKDSLPPEAFESWTDCQGVPRAPTASRAMRYLRGLPWANKPGPRQYPPELIDEARTLRGEGVEYKDIADLLGVPVGTAYSWCNPDRERAKVAAKVRRQRQRNAERKALAKQREREERDRLAKATGGELEVAYTHIRRALAAVSKAGTAELAERALLKAEEELITAMRRSA